MIRNNPDIIYGKIKPTVDAKGLRHYPNDYNPIIEYYEQIKRKQVIVSIKVEKTYKKIINDIKNSKSEWYYSPARANHILEFAENYCRHSKGKQGGKRITLDRKSTRLNSSH